jgi:hypothetical protein
MHLRHRPTKGKAPLGIDIMKRLDAIKEKLATQRDEARTDWVMKNRGIHNPSTVTMAILLEVDDARRAYVIAQARLDGAILMWIGAEEVYENGEARQTPGVSDRKSHGRPASRQ